MGSTMFNASGIERYRRKIPCSIIQAMSLSMDLNIMKSISSRASTCEIGGIAERESKSALAALNKELETLQESFGLITYVLISRVHSPRMLVSQALCSNVISIVLSNFRAHHLLAMMHQTG